MIFQYSILKKKMWAGIMISFATFLFSGCAGQGQEMEEPEPVMESTLAEEHEEAEADGVEEIEGTEEIEEVKESLAGSDDRNMPEIEASQDCIVKAIIQNAEEYQALVGCLEEYMDYSVLLLELAETDTVIYLDEILAYENFHILSIKNGGAISARNMEILNESPVRDIELYHTYSIEENILSQMPNLQYITIHINSWYSGVLSAKELLQNTDCISIVVKWDDDWKEEVYLEELVEWNEINAMLSESNHFLKALYVLNDEDYNYISYEFCGRGEEKWNTCVANACEAFICIKDRESYGNKYFDILKVPIESIDALSWLDGRRVRMEDINFDGYRDLIFVGNNDLSGSLDRCIGFLWNEKEQKYEWNATVPKHIAIDDEQERIIKIYTSSLQDDYFIYEYHDGIFTEKWLAVTFSMTENQVAWQYYEEGESLKRLERNYDEDAKLYYITYEENGIVTEEVMEEVDYNNKYGSYSDLGKKYFPEFDFYWAG